MKIPGIAIIRWLFAFILGISDSSKINFSTHQQKRQKLEDIIIWYLNFLLSLLLPAHAYS